ncbi:hypothetical protein [Microbacterium oxydans]|uniref:hypothetical protein n=1 Tax=Microbacterium oxydans TaxID=82380 RepID=UPI00366F8A3A
MKLVDKNTRIVLEFFAGRRSGMCTKTEIRDAARQVLDALEAAEAALTPTDDEREALDWALTYTRRYWQHGGEPESQRALSVLASALTSASASAGRHSATRSTERAKGFLTDVRETNEIRTFEVPEPSATLAAIERVARGDR